MKYNTFPQGLLLTFSVLSPIIFVVERKMMSQWEVEIPSSPVIEGGVELDDAGKVRTPEEYIDAKLRGIKDMLEGDVMKLSRDPELAIGQSSLCFRDLAFSIKPPDGSDEKVILTPTSGAYAAGSMVALMARKMGRGWGGGWEDGDVSLSKTSCEHRARVTRTLVILPTHMSSR